MTDAAGRLSTQAGPIMRKITVYSKTGCSLCVEAVDEIERVQREIPFELEEVDIEDDPALKEKYGHLIPVVELDGRVVFEYFVDAVRLRTLLKGGE
jgi:glutaredoxin